MENSSESKWKFHGVRVVHGNELDVNTAQTPGMNRAAAITNARMGAEKLWAGTVIIHPKAKTGAHHHGPVESVIYVVSGRARMKWGDRLEFTAEAGPGDFIYVPPFVPHQEINASDDEPLSCVLVRSGQAIRDLHRMALFHAARAPADVVRPEGLVDELLARIDGVVNLGLHGQPSLPTSRSSRLHAVGPNSLFQRW